MTLVIRGMKSPYLLTRGLASSDAVIRNIDWRFGCLRGTWVFGCPTVAYSFGCPISGYSFGGPQL